MFQLPFSKSSAIVRPSFGVVLWLKSQPSPSPVDPLHAPVAVYALVPRHQRYGAVVPLITSPSTPHSRSREVRSIGLLVYASAPFSYEVNRICVYAGAGGEPYGTDARRSIVRSAHAPLFHVGSECSSGETCASAYSYPQWSPTCEFASRLGKEPAGLIVGYAQLIESFSNATIQPPPVMSQ